MPTWTELERRFLELERPLDVARLDRQSGTEGEFWRVAAAFDVVAKSRFESLCTIAGRKLRETLTPQGLPQDLQDAPSDQVLWYRTLARNLRFYSPGSVAYPLNDQGERVGWIASGTIRNPAAVSAAHCLELAAMTGDEASPSAPLTIHVSGQNARLNVGSVDNSTNVISHEHKVVFEQARNAIEKNVPLQAQADLIGRLEALEKAVSTPTYSARYKDFVQTAADHVTVLGPVITALAGFLA